MGKNWLTKGIIDALNLRSKEGDEFTAIGAQINQLAEALREFYQALGIAMVPVIRGVREFYAEIPPECLEEIRRLNEEVNPYLLDGQELERTAKARMRGEY